MYTRFHDDSFVKATIYPNAASDADPLFLAASPHFTVLFDGVVTFSAKTVTLAEEARRCGEYLLALIEAERIAGKGGDNHIVFALAQSLIGAGDVALHAPPNTGVKLSGMNIAGDLVITGVGKKGG